jgi:sugar diacid utilization regulator
MVIDRLQRVLVTAMEQIHGAGEKDGPLDRVENIRDRGEIPELYPSGGLFGHDQQGQRRGQSAAELGIHPNTLNYRIERIEALLGASLDDIGWIERLDIALKLRRASK